MTSGHDRDWAQDPYRKTDGGLFWLRQRNVPDYLLESVRFKGSFDKARDLRGPEEVLFNPHDKIAELTLSSHGNRRVPLRITADPDTLSAHEAAAELGIGEFQGISDLRTFVENMSALDDKVGELTGQVPWMTASYKDLEEKTRIVLLYRDDYEAAHPEVSKGRPYWDLRISMKGKVSPLYYDVAADELFGTAPIPADPTVMVSNGSVAPAGSVPLDHELVMDLSGGMVQIEVDDTRQSPPLLNLETAKITLPNKSKKSFIVSDQTSFTSYSRLDDYRIGWQRYVDLSTRKQV